ncbi:MAG: alpha/beta hydrolase domain-containing protein [Acidobacteriota bacterium]
MLYSSAASRLRPFSVQVPTLHGRKENPLIQFFPFHLRENLPASYIPFPKTAADRIRTGDPRLSIAERYRSRADYMVRFTRATDELVKERWILKEDRAALIHRGEQEWDLATRP